VRAWTTRRWLAAVGGVIVFALLFGLPTDLVPNPIFGRQIEAPGWAYPALAVTAVLAGLLVATYVRNEPLRARVSVSSDSAAAGDRPDAAAGDRPDAPVDGPGDRRMSRDEKRATAGGLLSFFAVGCPTCNALVVLALGANGALAFFEPVQPFLAVGGIALLGDALRRRLRSETACEVPIRA
jgi:hypothetical protein